MYKLGHLRGSHFSANFFCGSMYVLGAKLNTRGSVFLVTSHSQSGPVDQSWTVLPSLVRNCGRSPLSAGRHSNNICPLIKILLTLRHSRTICLPIKLLISNIQGFNVVELSTKSISNCRLIDTAAPCYSQESFSQTLSNCYQKTLVWA